MSSIVFSTAFDSYNVEHIIYIGPVQEIPEQQRKNDMTHSFKLINRSGSVYCYFKGVESARKARGMLDAMIDSIKPHIFRYGYETIDVKSVVSYGRIVKLKNNENGKTHAFTVTMDTINEKSSLIWLTYKSEESAKKARAILWSIIESSCKLPIPEKLPNEKAETVAAECSS